MRAVPVQAHRRRTPPAVFFGAWEPKNSCAIDDDEVAPLPAGRCTHRFDEQTRILHPDVAKKCGDANVCESRTYPIGSRVLAQARGFCHPSGGLP
jgi:hypothetical protein